MYLHSIQLAFFFCCHDCHVHGSLTSCNLFSKNRFGAWIVCEIGKHKKYKTGDDADVSRKRWKVTDVSGGTLSFLNTSLQTLPAARSSQFKAAALEEWKTAVETPCAFHFCNE